MVIIDKLDFKRSDLLRADFLWHFFSVRGGLVRVVGEDDYVVVSPIPVYIVGRVFVGGSGVILAGERGVIVHVLMKYTRYLFNISCS